MPGERIIEQHFEDFEGVNKGQSHLTRGDNQAITCLNGRLTRQRSIMKRLGGKFIAGGGLFDYSAPQRGLHNYTYSDPTTSIVTEQLIGATADLYRLNNNSFTITRTGGSTNCSWSYTHDAASDTSRFVINQGGSPITLAGNPWFNTGTFYSNPFPQNITIYDLCAAIDAHANFSCTFPDIGARVNGTQAAVNTVTVDAGHTVVPGDYLLLYTSAIFSLNFRRVTATTATTITFGGAAFDFDDNQNLGSWASPACSMDFADDTTTRNVFASTAIIPVYHWHQVPDGSSTASPQLTISYIGYPGTTFTNLNDVCYFTRPHPTNGGFTYTAKYDGNRFYKAGLPAEPRVTQVAVGGAGNVDAGLHYWMVVLRMRDNRGNIIESNPSETQSATTAPSTTTITITTLLDAGTDWCLAYATVNGNQAATSTITVDTGHSLLPGDYACLFDDATSTIVHRLITAVTATTITITGGNVSVTDNYTISSGATGLIYRTKVGGYEFFLASENPLPGNVTTIGVVDNIADANLGEQYFPPDEPRDPPPDSQIASNHQGLLVLADGNTLYWSNPESPEYFPVYNQTSVPPTQKGSITCVHSDTDNMLAVFKSEAYYNVVGDLATSAYNILTVTEGDIGCASRHGIARVRGELLFVSQHGIVALRGGTLSYRFLPVWSSEFTRIDSTVPFTDVAPALDETALRLGIARAINYPHQNVCIFAAPAVSGQYWANGNSKVFAYDYNQGVWFDWSFSSHSAGGSQDGVIPVFPLRGAAIHRNRLYFLGSGFFAASASHGALFKFFTRDQFITIANLYSDDEDAITFDFQPAWKDGGQPSLDKEFKKVKTYSLEESEFVAGTISFDTYRNWSTSSASTTETFTFSASTTYEDVITLVLDKCTRMLFRWRNSTIHQSPQITGYEYIVVGDFENEDFSYQSGGE